MCDYLQVHTLHGVVWVGGGRERTVGNTHGVGKGGMLVCGRLDAAEMDRRLGKGPGSCDGSWLLLQSGEMCLALMTRGCLPGPAELKHIVS